MLASASARGSFSIGAGYDTDDGLLFTAAVVQPSLFGSGDELALFAGVSQRHQLFLPASSTARSTRSSCRRAAR